MKKLFKIPFLAALVVTVVVLGIAVVIGKLGIWWGPFVTAYPTQDDKILNAVLVVLGSEGAQLNSLRNIIIVGFITFGIVLFGMLYGLLSFYTRNRLLHERLDLICRRLGDVETRETQKVFPALYDLAKLIELVKPAAGNSPEFDSRLAQLMLLVGKIRRLPQIKVTAVDGEPVGEETEIDEILEQLAELTSKVGELEGKTDGNAATIGEIQEDLVRVKEDMDLAGVTNDAQEAREKANPSAGQQGPKPAPAHAAP